MKLPGTPIFTAVVFAGLLAIPGVAHAKRYTPAQFRVALETALGNRKGAAAYNKAAIFYQQALGDKRNKAFARTYSVLTTQALKRGGRVPLRLQWIATNTLLKGLTAGYFRGLTFNLDDARFNQSLSVLVQKIPLSQRTRSVSQALYNTLKNYSKRRGVGQNEVFTYYQKIDIKYRLPTPVS